MAKYPLHSGVKIVNSHPEGIIAFYKPEGVLSHPNTNKIEKKALLIATYDLDKECYSWKDEGSDVEKVLYLNNRLDGPTSGIIIGTLSFEMHEAVKKAFTERHCEKEYCALVKGRVYPKRGIWQDRLKREQSKGRLTVSGGGGTICETHYESIRYKDGVVPVTLLKLMPKTGRTHQLRVQCAMRKHPIMGDKKYGDFKNNRLYAKSTGNTRLLLHASKVSIPLVFRGKTITFKAKCEKALD